MTLNEWEQSNIEVLTSREMGEWLSRRENRLLDKIRAEIEVMSTSHCGGYIGLDKQEVLKVIDKHLKGESE